MQFQWNVVHQLWSFVLKKIAQDVHGFPRGYMHSTAKKPSVIRQSYCSVNNLGKNILSTSLLCVACRRNALIRRHSCQSNEEGFVFPNGVLKDLGQILPFSAKSWQPQRDSCQSHEDVCVFLNLGKISVQLPRSRQNVCWS